MSFEQAYDNLNPTVPLQHDSEFLVKELYGEFCDTVRDRLLVGKSRRSKLLLSGHIGCGKSTLLNVIECDPKVVQAFLVVRCSIKEFVEPNELDHIDLLLAIALTVVDAAHEAGIKLDTGTGKKVVEIYRELRGLLVHTKATQSTRKATASASAGVGLPKALAWLSADFRAEYKLQDEFRREVREHFRPRLTDFIKTINLLLDSVTARLAGKELLVLVDDTDKPVADTARTLFGNYAGQLGQPNASVVYVVDTSVSCFEEFPAISNRLGGEEFFPAVIVQPEGNNPRTPREQVLCDLLRRRVPASVIPEEHLLRLARLSGGVVRELLRLAQHSVFFGRGKVTPDDITRAETKVFNSFNFDASDVKVLKAVLKDKTWLPTDETEKKSFFRLLYWTALFQYRNGDRKWHRPNPIFIPWLQKLS